jgi:hypothetical protein
MLLPIMEKEVKKILDAKIIIPLRHSEWVANLVPVRKKNGEIRLCVDFRNLNRSSKKDNYPLPKMEHILQRVTGSSRMSMIDGFSSYNQISVLPEDREKTTFTTPWGTFMYDKIPFGLLGMCYILCMCVCGRVRLTTASDDPSSSALCVVCAGRFPRGVPGGAGMPPLVTRTGH